MKRKLIIGLLIFGAFAYGLLVGKKEVFPYEQIVSIKKELSGSKFNIIREPDEKIIYKSSVSFTKKKENLKLHMFYPKNYNKENNQEYPAIVFFFGGSWISGTPEQFYGQCDYFSKKGFICASAEYRVASRDYTTPQQSVEDAKSAIRFLRKNAKTYRIDDNRIIAGGGSAGGHIAAATGTLNKYENESEDLSISSQPNAMILFNPVFDNSKNGYGYERVKYFWKDISPMHNISKETPPTIILLGDKDHHIPVSTAIRFKNKMKDMGSVCDLMIYKNQLHGFFNRGKMYKQTLNDIDKFLEKIGYLK